MRPGQSFHVTVHVHVREKRDRLDELVLPALTNAVDLGDERKRVPAVDGTDFYETLTVAAGTVGHGQFHPGLHRCDRSGAPDARCAIPRNR